jgi:hypothetical protein
VIVGARVSFSNADLATRARRRGVGHLSENCHHAGDLESLLGDGASRGSGAKGQAASGVVAALVEGLGRSRGGESRGGEEGDDGGGEMHCEV